MTVGGWIPEYQFLSQFKVSLGDAFLDYLAHDVCHLELWAQRRDISAERIASCTIPLSSLLEVC